MHDAWLRPARSQISIIISRLEGFINRLRPIECKLSNKTGKSCRSFRITPFLLFFFPSILLFFVSISFLFLFVSFTIFIPISLSYILFFILFSSSSLFFFFIYDSLFLSSFRLYTFSHLFIFSPSLSFLFSSL